MIEKKFEIVYFPPEKLTPYFRNTKNHPTEQIDKIASSISEFKFDQPIVVDGDNIIIKGHGRREAALRLKMKTIPVIVRTDLSEAQKKAARIMDNKSAESDWIESDLALEFKDLKELDFDLALTGFEVEDIEVIFENNSPDFEGHSDPDEVPENVVTVCGEGQLWKLGNHRLLCGDCTDVKQVERLMGGEKVDMTFTDPPYGVSIGDKNKLLDRTKKKKYKSIKENIKNDTLSPDELKEVLLKSFKNLKKYSNDCCSYYVTSPQGGELGMMMLLMMIDSGLPVRHVIIWVKNRQCFSFGRLDYEYKHEPILYTWNKKHKFYGKGQHKNSVWEIAKELKCNLHPTMKPVELIENAILNSSLSGMVVADFFLGSGSTLIACEKTKRKCKGLEIDPHYCDVILQRWSDFTKLDPVREDGELFSELKKISDNKAGL